MLRFRPVGGIGPAFPGAHLKRLASALLVFLLASGCALTRRPAAGPSEEEGGLLVVYLLPLLRDAARLSFHIDHLSAVREDGAGLPLSLSLTDVKGGEASERRLGARSLPPGRYSGLSLEVSAPSLRGDRGEAALVPPQGPIAIPAPFTVETRRGIVLSLRLDDRIPLEPGTRFVPVFSAVVPQRPAPGLIGVASSRGSDLVTIFDKITGQVGGVVPTGRLPVGLSVDSERRRAYVAASGDDTIETIGLLEQDVLSRLSLRGGDEPVELALTPDGRTLLSANEGSSTVSVIDAVALVETARVKVGNGPGSILVDPAGRRAYTFDTAASTVTVLDVAARGVVGTIATEAGPLRGQFNRAGDRLYVIHRSSPYLTVIDPPALAVTERVYVGPGATALKVDTQTDQIYLARRGAWAIEIFDPRSFLPIDAIPTDGEVSFLTIDHEGNTLYLVLSESDQVQVLRIVGKEIAARAEVGDDPRRAAVSGER